MSHLFNHSGVTFIYNSDLSGDVVLVSDGFEPKRGQLGHEVKVPGVAILAFVAEHVRREKIAELEAASDLEILIGLGSCVL